MANRAQAIQICMTCVLTVIAVAVAVSGSFACLSLDLGRLVSADAAGQMLHFLLSFFPPELSPGFLARTAGSMLETLAISAVGTLCAAILGFALALPASGLYGAALRALSRFLLNLLRSIPELVWATLTVLAAGLGPFAGALALALHAAGVLGRLFAEALENAPGAPARALAEAGTSPALAFVYGNAALRAAPVPGLHPVSLGNEHPHGGSPRLRRRRRARANAVLRALPLPAASGLHGHLRHARACRIGRHG
jgi:phosphonate transport system permease protein